MRNLKFFFLLLVLNINAQQGGMWIPSLLSGARESEMKALGMKISAEDIYSTNKSSIKDAVPQFNGGCTSEIISDKSLLLTNHHCGFGAIQNLSSVEKDYLTNGFWAYKLEEELPNKNLEVTFVISINDVTTQILEGVAALTTETEKQKKIQENIAKTIANFAKESWQENKIRTFFDGNQYLLFVTESFKDIRLVGTPPSSIGKFGSDTDNWVWPRHTGDFSLFRIYADKNNRPAAYSADNVPYKPKYFLPVSAKGIKENDFTMVMGYPGRTQEFLPSAAVSQIVNTLNPAKIEIRAAALKVQDGFMRKDNAIKIQYASKYAGVANYWKKWIGETKGLKKSDAIGIKQEFEKDFQNKVVAAKKQAEYGNIIADFNKNYADINDLALARDYFMEVVQRNTELLSFCFRLYALEQVYNAKGEKAFNEAKLNVINDMDDVYKNFNPQVDEKVFEQLFALYQKNVPQQFLPDTIKTLNPSNTATEIYSKSSLTSLDGLKNILNVEAKTAMANLNSDKAYAFAKQLILTYQEKVASPYNVLNLKIIALQRTYTNATMELFPKARLFPDANGTLRVTFGKIKGYKPVDAVSYDPITYLDGVIEKYIPGDYEFDVPKKLVDLYNSKDYGRYGVKGKMPVCFIGTNHTTGGNSGSPAIDANGNLIGLNFDRVWEGTMSDIYYSPEICRNIMVDSRYILFIIDKFAGAKNLIDEMKIIY